MSQETFLEKTEPDQDLDSSKLWRLPTGPIDVRSVPLMGLFLLVCLYTLYWGRSIFFPITLALLLSFLLTPVMRLLRRVYIPEAVGAALVLFSLLFIVGYGAYRLSAPATHWMAEAPRAVHHLEQKVRALKKPVEEMGKATELLGAITSLESKKGREVEVKKPSWNEALVGFTGEFVASLAVTVVLLYFFLASGDLFLQKLLKVLPHLNDKKHAVEIVQEIQQHISRYLLTVSGINTCVGIAVGFAMYLLGMPNPALWGVMAALLTFIPYLGPLVGVGVVIIVAGLAFENLGWIALVGISYWGIAVIEGAFISPMIIGHRLALNPVALLVGLSLWGWIWGVGGALLAVPLMATFKLCCDHIEPLAPIGEFLGR